MAAANVPIFNRLPLHVLTTCLDTIQTFHTAITEIVVNTPRRLKPH